MDTNKEATGSYSVWLPGSALILSLVVSTFALTRSPFLETRPLGAQFQPETPIEARLWQDPFDALERYRKRIKDKGDTLAPPPCIHALPDGKAQLIVALVEDGAYAEAVELRRRMRYAILAGLKSAHLVPEDEQHIRCIAMAENLSSGNSNGPVEIPYESFVVNPLEHTSDSDNQPPPYTRTHLLWLKQEAIKIDPLAQLERLRKTLTEDPSTETLKVIGPADSAMLREIYRQEASARYNMTYNGRSVEIPELVEIYSPLATAEKSLLMRNFDTNGKDRASPFRSLKLLRTVSDDATMVKLLLEELKLRRVDPAAGAGCVSPDNETQCFKGPQWRSSNRVALISEWDSFYSRALIESFREQVGRAGSATIEESTVDRWVLRFSYLRGLDGRLPEDAVANTDPKMEKDNRKLDLSPLEKSDGNSQLDYLRRLADHILLQDQAYRRANKSAIGAIGVMGLDTYDKLLVLQALKSRMPNKLYFSTDLDARMLQRGQAQVTRNLILAAPYGLTLTRALQQEVPPFRDSLQSAVFISVLAALSPEPFGTKRWKFDYSRSGLLSPSIYEVGMSGFIPLNSSSTQKRAPDCAPASDDGSGTGSYIGPRDIMALRCLQDPSPPIYPQVSAALKEQLHRTQSFFRAGPLALVLLILGLLLGWRSCRSRQASMGLGAWVPLALYGAAAFTAWNATRTWRVELLWVTFVLILLGLIGSNLNRRAWHRMAATAGKTPLARSTFDANGWYVLVPLVTFVLALLWAYQIRDELTEHGLGEPMFLLEGISAWPTLALRMLAVLTSLAALAWGWRSLRLNRQEIEREYQLSGLMQRYRIGMWVQLRRLTKNGSLRPVTRLGEALSLWLYHIFLPLSPNTPHVYSVVHDRRLRPFAGTDGRIPGLFLAYWREHCICGSFGARLLRAMLATWIFLVLSSVLFVLWPMDGDPVRGTLPILLWIWLPPAITFNLLVFWVVDANRLLTRFIRQLSDDFSIWPRRLRQEHQHIFGMGKHPCIDEWVGLTLIAKRTAAVNRLIYAPTVVLLVLIASRSSLFDNWSTPPGMMIMFVLTGLILLISALSLRRAAEKARTIGLQRIDQYLLEAPDSNPEYAKFRMIRERIVTLNTGAFSRYADEPLVRALLLSLTGIGGSVIVDALNYAKF